MFNFRTFKCFADDTNVSGGGVTESPLEPKTRVEYFLNKIAEAVENSGGEGGGDGGSSGGVLVVNIIEDTENQVYRFDKTAAQVYSALTTTGCVAVYNEEITQMNGAIGKGRTYIFEPQFKYSSDFSNTFFAGNGDDYPSFGSPK